MSETEDIRTEAVTRPGAFLGKISSDVRTMAAAVCREDPGHLILDVGCGNGLLFAEIGAIDGTFYGLDPDGQILHEGRRILADNQVPLIALVHQRGKREQPVSNRTDLKPGDRVWFGWMRDQSELVTERLRGADFRAVVPEAESEKEG